MGAVDARAAVSADRGPPLPLYLIRSGYNYPDLALHVAHEAEGEQEAHDDAAPAITP